MYDYLIVGAGFAGCVLAERLSTLKNKKILLIDTRSHVGGNAYDYFDDDGLLVHMYGPHIFHTNSSRVFNYLSDFTNWRFYEHKVLSYVDGKYLPFPINIDTINNLYGKNFSHAKEMKAFFRSRSEFREEILSFEDYVVGKIGWDLYEKFFKNYSIKQWGIDPRNISASVAARIPVRTNFDDRYFTDKYQCIPSNGYTKMFNKLIDHPKIEIKLGINYHELKRKIEYGTLIFTGPIDSYFGYKYGRLKYRSLNFSFKEFDKEYIQRTAVINYPNDFPYTRTTEFKHITGQSHPKTILMYEFPCDTGDPYYPVQNSETLAVFKKYKDMVGRTKKTLFVGRLGTYQYLNMDQVVEQSLSTFDRIARC